MKQSWLVIMGFLSCVEPLYPCDSVSVPRSAAHYGIIRFKVFTYCYEIFRREVPEHLSLLACFVKSEYLILICSMYCWNFKHGNFISPYSWLSFVTFLNNVKFNSVSACPMKEADPWRMNLAFLL